MEALSSPSLMPSSVLWYALGLLGNTTTLVATLNARAYLTDWAKRAAVVRRWYWEQLLSSAETSRGLHQVEGVRSVAL